MYCFEHKRESKNYVIADTDRKESKLKQLKGCNAHINFILNKDSVSFDNSGLLCYYYERTNYVDKHYHEIELKRAEEKAIKKTALEEISKFSQDTAPKSIIKYLADNKNLEVSYHQVYRNLLKKVKQWKDKDAEMLIKELNQGKYEYAVEYDELENEECVLSYVSFCTQKAKKIFSKYNDVFWVDPKYGTNKYGMRLINFTIAELKERIGSFLLRLQKMKKNLLSRKS